MVVDSSVWLEIIFSGQLAATCEREIAKQKILLPSLVLFEVYKRVKIKTDESRALEVMGMMSIHTILDLTRDVALLAGDLSLEYGMAMADSMVLAHARFEKVKLLTLDNDFNNIPGVLVLR